MASKGVVMLKFNQHTLAALHFTLDDPSFKAVVISPTRLIWQVSHEVVAREVHDELLTQGVNVRCFKEQFWMLEVRA